MLYRHIFNLALLLCLTMTLTGCSQSVPKPSDPDAAREALLKALDAWKQGQTLDGFKQSDSHITVVDRYWLNGVKLQDFNVENSSQPDGFDVRLIAQLTTVDKAGKSSRTKAVFNVSTTPAVVIVRMEGN